MLPVVGFLFFPWKKTLLPYSYIRNSYRRFCKQDSCDHVMAAKVSKGARGKWKGEEKSGMWFVNLIYTDHKKKVWDIQLSDEVS